MTSPRSIDVTEPIQALIRSRALVDPAPLQDPDVPLEALVPAAEREPS